MGLALEFAVGIYAAIVLCIFALQRRLMYHPLKAISPPSAYGLHGVEDITLTAADGVKLQAWAHAPRAGFPTIVYFHGNAANLADRAEKFAGFVKAGFGFIAVSYRGFGKSEGRPSEKGVYADADAAVTYATTALQIPENQLIYYGESLGTGVAVHTAKARPPGLLVLEAAYTSVATRSAELYPFVLGVRHLVRDKYDSLLKIKNIAVPLLMLHGERDNVIPLAHGQSLFAAAPGPKEMVVYPEVYHADYSSDQTVVPLLAAARKYGLIAT